ncbi:MMPL family transporter [Conexibacter woesei]|uniref:MMPL domain protein n=1 Tax=Conexibacter woesei (strain DSM 14684 / CCUG 47730 / CIP 108061 / JCM 11494 / NBRC 100937 / ID131577) TaxID=469383 RepID=D3F562_CONWI|nr:MMPL family transporter [Conexibacter woesei]ADB48640.1 MMPL domain protein [Conexibacter woesei DSM 14684]
MKSNDRGGLHRLGRFCVRRHRLVLLVWVLGAVGLGVWAGQLGTQTNDNVSLPGTDSQRAADVLDRDFSSGASNGTNPIVLRAPAGVRLTDAAERRAVTAIAAAYARDPGVRAVVSPLEPAGASQLSRDARIGYLGLSLRDSPSTLTLSEAERLLSVAQDAARPAGLQVAAGGYLGADLSQAGSADSEAIGLLAAVVVLLFTFGTVVAMGLPLLTAILGLGTGLSLITLASHVVQVPSTAPALATMIGLGVGIDYALFVVTRHREQMAAGVELRESIARAVATSGSAVVFAGGTVVIALCSLLLTGIPLVQQMGCLAAIAVLVAVLAAITLLPAALAAVGPRIDSLALPWVRRARREAEAERARAASAGAPAAGSAAASAAPASDSATASATSAASAAPASAGAAAPAHPTMWLRWARLVADRPWPALVVALLVLGALAWPLTSLDLGQSDTGQLPRDTTARQAYDMLAEGFGAGSNGPLLIAVRLPADAARASAEAVAGRLAAALRATPGVAAVGPPLPAPRGDALLLTLTPTTAPSAPATEALVRHLRADTIPAALGDSGTAAFVGGSTAGYIDLADEIRDRLPLVIAVVLTLSFLLLTLAFRSLIVPLKAVLMNLLSIGAAFGVVSFVFSHDWSAQLLGVEGAAPIVSFVPLMMFAILFGLSMDYEVFLMTHVRERWQATGDAHRAVIEGLAGTARVITSAALIMVAVFLAFLLDGNPTIKQFGLGMAVAVAVDATVIRCLLVPAIMSLLGRRAWWMPRRLERLTPRLSIEGDG